MPYIFTLIVKFSAQNANFSYNNFIKSDLRDIKENEKKV